SDIRLRLQQQFEASDAYQSAQKEVRDAQAQYDDAVAQARRSLTGQQAYQEAIDRKRQAADELDAMHAAYREPIAAAPTTQPAPIAPQLFDAARAKLDAARRVSRLEADLLQTD